MSAEITNEAFSEVVHERAVASSCTLIRSDQRAQGVCVMLPVITLTCMVLKRVMLCII